MKSFITLILCICSFSIQAEMEYINTSTYECAHDGASYEVLRKSSEIEIKQRRIFGPKAKWEVVGFCKDKCDKIKTIKENLCFVEFKVFNEFAKNGKMPEINQFDQEEYDEYQEDRMAKARRYRNFQEARFFINASMSN